MELGAEVADPPSVLADELLSPDELADDEDMSLFSFFGLGLAASPEVLAFRGLRRPGGMWRPKGKGGLGCLFGLAKGRKGNLRWWQGPAGSMVSCKCWASGGPCNILWNCVIPTGISAKFGPRSIKMWLRAMCMVVNRGISTPIEERSNCTLGLLVPVKQAPIRIMPL